MGDGISREIFVQDVTAKPADRADVSPNAWMPFSYIWPEFDGLMRDEYDMEFGDNDPLFDEWGAVVEKTFDDFTRLLGLNIVQFTEKKGGWFGRKKWEIAETTVAAEYVMLLSTMGGEISSFLITSRTSGEIKQQMSEAGWESSAISPLGICGFTLGYEVCNVEIWFSGHKDVFMNCLEQAAAVYGYSVKKNAKVYKYSLRN